MLGIAERKRVTPRDARGNRGRVSSSFYAVVL